MDSRSKYPNLPDDIVNFILLELPVKSLLRFKSSCKSWCCSIDDPDFIKCHLHKSSTDISRQKILFFDIVEGKIPCDYSFKVLSMEASISADSQVVSLDETNIPRFHSNIHYLEVSSCNGLVLIYHPDIGMILWNPPIRKYKRIPMPRLLQHKPCIVWPKFGFAYDFVAEDYKVLCVHSRYTPYTTYPRYIVEIYSVKNQSWRTIGTIFPIPTDFPLYLYNDPVSLNGAIHLMAISDAARLPSSEHWVISFHLADEKFIETPVPNKCGEHLKLRAFGDRVCVMGTVGEDILIWSLEKDVKTTLFTWKFITKFPTLGSVIGIPQCSGDVICVKENGNILWRKYDGRFIEYNARKDEYTEFNVKEIPPSTGKMTLYVESLVCLKIPWD